MVLIPAQNKTDKAVIWINPEYIIRARIQNPPIEYEVWLSNHTSVYLVDTRIIERMQYTAPLNGKGIKNVVLPNHQL